MSHSTRIPLLALAVFAVTACEDSAVPTQPGPAVAGTTPARQSAPPPAGIVTIATFGGTTEIWPFTGTDVAGTASDPINLLFRGNADPRAIRSALMSLDGNRTAFGFPAGMPFDCRWEDTPSGGVQSAWSDEGGWSGSAIQLQCGEYAPLRFHLRLFRTGSGSIGNAHFEVLIPGTADHQVLSWELAEQLVMVDMLRTGLLDQAAPLMPSGPINPAPSYRTIPAIIFNGLPAELQALAAGAPGPSATDVPIGSDGSATIFNVVGQPAAVVPGTSRSFTLMYDQVVPKPFCGGPGDYVYVRGPVTLREYARIEGGRYATHFVAEGQLEVVPVNPLTGEPAGEPMLAVVAEHHETSIDAGSDRVWSWLMQQLTPRGQEGGARLESQISIDSRGTAFAFTSVSCGS